MEPENNIQFFKVFIYIKTDVYAKIDSLEKIFTLN